MAHEKKIAKFNVEYAAGKIDAEIKEAHKHLEADGYDLDASIAKHREKHPVEKKEKADKPK